MVDEFIKETEQETGGGTTDASRDKLQSDSGDREDLVRAAKSITQELKNGGSSRITGQFGKFMLTDGDTQPLGKIDDASGNALRIGDSKGDDDAKAIRDLLHDFKVNRWHPDDPDMPMIDPDAGIKWKEEPKGWAAIGKGGDGGDPDFGKHDEKPQSEQPVIVTGWLETDPPKPIYGPNPHFGDTRYDPTEPPQGMRVVGYLDSDPPIPLYGPKPTGFEPKAL
jgi:hypothetical protein